MKLFPLALVTSSESRSRSLPSRRPALPTLLIGFAVAGCLAIRATASSPVAPPDTVLTATFAALGALASQPSHSVVSPYGIKPAVILTANQDNSYDVAYHVAGTSRIAVANFDAAGTLVRQMEPVGLFGAKSLLGFARIPEDGSFAVASSRDNASNGAGFEYWISRTSGTGAAIFSTRVFGDQNQTTVGSKGQPGWFSSGRLAYDPASQKLLLYTGHSQRWGDNVRHQGGYVASMTLSGVPTLLNDWYCSHNFDQRLLVDGGRFYTLAHGDAFPRGLVLGTWSGGGLEHDHVYFSIPGETGANATSTQTGGFVRLPNGNFGVVYSTAVGRSNYDVRYEEITSGGAVVSSTWLTNHPANTLAIFPKIARYGDGAAVLWEEVRNGSVVAVRTKLVSFPGLGDTPAGTLSDAAARLSPFYDPACLPNGDILWASTRGSNTIVIHRIPGAFPAGSSPRLVNVKIHAATPVSPAGISGRVVGGPANALAILQVSSDLGEADPWENIATFALDAVGQADFGPVNDPSGMGAKRDFFRVSIP